MSQRTGRLTILALLGVVIASALVFGVARAFGLIPAANFGAMLIPLGVVRWQRARGKRAGLTVFAATTVGFTALFMLYYYWYAYQRWIASGRLAPFAWFSQEAATTTLACGGLGAAVGLLVGGAVWLAERRMERARQADDNAATTVPGTAGGGDSPSGRL